MRSGGHRQNSDGLDLYLAEIGRHPVLDREDERRLARRAGRGDREALDRLVTTNLRFVVSVAKRYRGLGVPFEDLINEGNLGLLRAAERFDADRGVRFVTYAVWWIRQAMLAAIAEASGPTPPPVRTSRPGAGRRDVREPPGGGTRLLSLDSDGAGTGGEPLAARVPDPRQGRAHRRVHARALRNALERGLAFLPPREERVLRLYFGLDGARPLPLTEIGRELGVSRERARQIRSRGLQRLRRGPHARSLEGFLG